MLAILDDAALGAARTALLGPDGDALIDLIFRCNLRRPLDGVPDRAFTLAASLGWIDAAQALTATGRLVADPVREYRFWIDRGRELHGERDHELLRAARYAGKDVLELGSGFGCNLFSLAPHARRVAGLEPVALYRQFTEIFATREGLPVPENVAGQAEALPFGDGEFDVVLCYSAHQYMDVRQALRETARVLRRGGQMQVIGGTLRGWGSRLGRSLTSARLGAAWRDALTIVNTLWYERTCRRLYVPRSAAATSAPIYPRPRFVDRWTRQVGLQPRLDLRRRLGPETVFVADKP